MVKKLSIIINLCRALFKEKGAWLFLVRLWSLFRHFMISDKVELVQRAAPLHFRECDNPEVSIVIPVHNNSIYTYNCLSSILNNTTDADYEVIVVNDASSDNSAEILAEIDNIKIITNEENAGFVKSCNIGASISKGRYLHFLNNDTVVLPGWLTSLLKTFHLDKRTGAAGSKLVYPNMILQEAGSIVWQDGSASNFGKYDLSSKPEYNYLREVDYCSGASLMITRDLFDKIGGFSEEFSPAYWEDADICFAVRHHGCKVLYQPESVVVHFEGVSAGTDLAPGMKKFQEINRQKFKEKWAAELSEHCIKSKQNFTIASKRHGLAAD